MTTSEFEKSKSEEYALLCNFPNDFDEKDPEQIAIFSKRMKELRLENKKTLDQVSQELLLSKTIISRYENYDKDNQRRLKSIPMKQLISICESYEVTPHYLLGYVDGKKEVLDIKDGNIVKGNNGENRILTVPMEFPAVNIAYCIEKLKNLNIENHLLFQQIINLLNATPNMQKMCANILKAIFGNKNTFVHIDEGVSVDK